MQEDFDQIYQNCFDPVYRYVLSLSENPVVAEEITQETFFKALQSLDRFQGKSNLKSWLCAIAKNQWLSEQRKNDLRPVVLHFDFNGKPRINRQFGDFRLVLFIVYRILFIFNRPL